MLIIKQPLSTNNFFCFDSSYLLTLRPESSCSVSETIIYYLRSFSLLSFFAPINLSAQIKVSSRTPLTTEPLMYITVQYEGKGGGISNGSVNIKLETRKGWNELTFSAGIHQQESEVRAGHQDFERKDVAGRHHKLSGSSGKAQEGKYSRKNNPAVESMKKVIANKKALRLEENDYYQYQKYEKMKMSVNDVTPEKMEKGIYKKFFFKDQVELSSKPTR